MKLLAMGIFLVCVPTYAQDVLPKATLRPFERLKQRQKIEIAIAAHRSFKMPDDSLSPMVTAMATGIKDDGHVLTLTGVEITINNVVMTADELIYDWDTHQIEPRGNVHLKPIQ